MWWTCVSKSTVCQKFSRWKGTVQETKFTHWCRRRVSDISSGKARWRGEYQLHISLQLGTESLHSDEGQQFLDAEYLCRYEGGKILHRFIILNSFIDMLNAGNNCFRLISITWQKKMKILANVSSKCCHPWRNLLKNAKRRLRKINSSWRLFAKLISSNLSKVYPGRVRISSINRCLIAWKNLGRINNLF